MKIAVVKEFYEIFKSKFDNVVLLDQNTSGADFTVGNDDFPQADICIHPSLLPAFKGKDALKKAFVAGVKVSGITIYRPKGNKIIFQYPVLIGNLTHFDEFCEEMRKIQEMIYPIVVEKILKDEAFDFGDLFFSHKGCGNCKNCGR